MLSAGLEPGQMLSNIFQQAPELCTFANLDLQVSSKCWRVHAGFFFGCGGTQRTSLCARLMQQGQECSMALANQQAVHTLLWRPPGSSEG